MEYSLYASSCSTYTQELTSLLSEADVKILSAVLKDLTLIGYTDWALKQSDYIDFYLSLTPSERRLKKNRISEDNLRLILILACIQRVAAAQAFLTALHNNALESPVPYRDMTIRASLAYLEAVGDLASPFSYWPFSDICESPFE